MSARRAPAVSPATVAIAVLPLLQEHPGPADLLTAERAQEVRHQAVHQLEVGGQRRRVLLGVVQDLLAVTLGVHRRAGTAVDEHELRSQDEALALHVLTHGTDDTAAEAVVGLLSRLGA